MSTTVWWGTFLVITAAFLTGLAHTWGKYCVSKMEFYPFLSIRLVSSCFCLFLLHHFWPLKQDLLPLPNNYYIFYIIATGLISPFLLNLTLFKAMQYLPVNVVSPVFQSFPILVLAFNWIVFPASISLFLVSGVILVSIGVAIFAYFRKVPGQDKPLKLQWILVVLSASFLMGITIIVWQYAKKYLSPIAINYYQTISSAIGFTLFAICSKQKWGPFSFEIWGKAIGSGVLIFAVANVLSVSALKFISSSAISSLLSLSVLFTGLLAWISLGERWTKIQFIGALLVTFGVIFLSQKG